ADPSVRLAAAEALGAGKTADPAALATLVGDRDRGVRLAALKAAVQTRALADPERTLRAAFRLGDVDERVLLVEAARAFNAAELVRAAAADRDPAVRRAVVAAAAALGPRGFSLVEGALDDRDSGVRAAALRAVGQTAGGVPQVPAAVETLAKTGTPEDREAAVGALAASGPAGAARAAEIVGGLLADRGESTRVSAARAAGRLAERDPGRATPLLERALADAAYDVRRAATPALAAAYA